MFLDQLMETVAFPAQHDYRGRNEVYFVVWLSTPFIEAVDPKSLVLQVLQRFCHVADADYGQVFQRSRGGLGDRVRETRGAAFWNQNGIGSSSVGGADNGAEIVGIFDTIQDDNHFGALDDIVLIGVLCGCAKGDDALVRLVPTGTLQRVARFKAYRNAILPAEVDDLLKARPAGTLGNEDTVEGPFCFQRFADRVHTDKNSHLMMVADWIRGK